MIDKELLDILICPKCKGTVKLHNDKEYLICEKCNLAYIISEDVPIMLIDKAINIEEIKTVNN